MLHEHSNLSDSAYLRRLGLAVRSRRQFQGTNRKQLAERSGVSERYLAQLESGTGNISIVRLRHVAVALGCRINQLLEPNEIGHSDAGTKDRIALIGLRGAGKTTLGKLIAGKLGVEFVELTARIERNSGLQLGDIFNLYGDAGYRRLEQRELRKVTDELDACVLAPAGGVCEDDETFGWLLSHFRTIWLTAAPQEHMDRVIAQGDMRPMDGYEEALSELKVILGSRAHAYARAGHVVDTAGRSVEDVCRELLETIRPD